MDPNMDPDMDRDGGLEGRVPTGAEPDPSVEDIPESQEIDFVTLGMFIIGMFLLLFAPFCGGSPSPSPGLSLQTTHNHLHT